MRKLNTLLDSGLLKATDRLKMIEQHLQYHLTNELACHIKVVSLVNAELKISVDSNAWASKVRYLQKEIIKSFQSDPEYYVQKLTIRVAEWQPGFTESIPAILSDSGKKQIGLAVSGMSDPDLKKAFKKFIED